MPIERNGTRGKEFSLSWRLTMCNPIIVIIANTNPINKANTPFSAPSKNAVAVVIFISAPPMDPGRVIATIICGINTETAPITMLVRLVLSSPTKESIKIIIHIESETSLV